MSEPNEPNIAPANFGEDVTEDFAEAWEGAAEALNKAVLTEQENTRKLRLSKDWPTLNTEAEMRKELVAQGCPEGIADNIAFQYGWGMQVAFRGGFNAGLGYSAELKPRCR